MSMQNSERKPEAYTTAIIPECSHCGTPMRVTGAVIEAHQQLVTYECFACLMIVHRHARAAHAPVGRQG